MNEISGGLLSNYLSGRNHNELKGHHRALLLVEHDLEEILSNFE